MLIAINVAEFTVSGIYDITWNLLPFDALVLPREKKDLLQALVQQTTTESSGPKFEDVVEDKGQGLVVLLQYDPPTHLLTLSDQPQRLARRRQDLDCRSCV